jgi:hypothetical protein
LPDLLLLRYVDEDRAGCEGDGMAIAQRDFLHESDVLIRQLGGHLETLRVLSPPADLELAERIAATLRRLVVDTAWASAVDRARVRAAVHFFVSRTDIRQERRPPRPLAVDLRVVNEIVRDLGRRDLLLSERLTA